MKGVTAATTSQQQQQRKQQTMIMTRCCRCHHHDHGNNNEGRHRCFHIATTITKTTTNQTVGTSRSIDLSKYLVEQQEQEHTFDIGKCRQHTTIDGDHRSRTTVVGFFRCGNIVIADNGVNVQPQMLSSSLQNVLLLLLLLFGVG
jgi:hypothetical protein